MKVSLVIMAAGLGSRYGGSKQVDGIGPHNEILMEYSIYDALRAGFNKVVFIIKPEMEEMMHRICGDYLAKKTALVRSKAPVSDQRAEAGWVRGLGYSPVAVEPA